MNKQNNIGDRLKEWMDSKELNASHFAKQLQIQRSALSHIFSGRNKPSVDVLLKIKSAYPEINLDWLITGEIAIQKSTENSNIIEDDVDIDANNVTDVNSLHVSIDNQEIKKVVQIEKKSNSKNRILIRIIELYSDGTFKHFNS